MIFPDGILYILANHFLFFINFMFILKKGQAGTKMKWTTVDSGTFMSSTKVSFWCIKSGVAPLKTGFVVC